MRHSEHKKCNCCECVWKRILANKNKNLRLITKSGLWLSYTVDELNIIWLPHEPTQAKLYPQSKEQICTSLPARSSNLSPSFYPGTAQSYKWALLNHKLIWV